MTTKRRLITDSFKVVKRSRKGGKREKSPTPPPSPQKEADRVREEELEKLRQFDLDWSFGPCTGISRLQRWERAKLHGLNPPEEIRDLLLQTHADPEYNLGRCREVPLSCKSLFMRTIPQERACGVDILSEEDTNKLQSKPGFFYVSVLYEKEKRKKQICTTATMFQRLNPAVVFVWFSSL
uniref:Uncharacterized protein n=1 Tax=Astatotilapia calliptera TaxID=8154 RepID=A0A3P8QCC1_ASTCA